MRAPDDTLFDTGPDDGWLRAYTTPPPVQAWRERFAARAAFFAARKLPWAMLLVPDKLSVEGERLLPPGGVPPGQVLARALGPPCIWPGDYLRRQRQAGFRLWPRTGGTWTVLGAVCAFQWLADRIGLDLDWTLWEALPARAENRRGDLWTPEQADLPPDRVDVRDPPPGLVRIYADALSATDTSPASGAHVAWSNPGAQHDATVLMFGTALTGHRAGEGGLLFVALLFFRTVHVIRSVSLDTGLIERLAPDLVIIETPERALDRVPDDRLDSAAEVFREMRIRSATGV